MIKIIQCFGFLYIMRFFVSVLLVFSALLHAQTDSQLGEEAAQKEAQKAPAAILVTSIALRSVLKHQASSVSAEVISLNHAQISAQATGEVLSIAAEVGEKVEKGAALVTLDCRQAKLSLAAARDARNLASKEFKRASTLRKSNTISEQQVNQAQSALDQARIRKQQADLAVSHCTVSAPFSGVVTQRQVQLGAVAVAGVPIMTLLQIDAAELSAKLNPEQLAQIQKSNKVAFEAQGVQYAVALRAALPLVDSMSNKQSARFAFSGSVPPAGLSGKLKWQSDALFLPVNFVIERENRLGYFWVDGAKARFSSLPNAKLGHPAKLNEQGLDNRKIVVEGRNRLKDGDAVMVQN